MNFRVSPVQGLDPGYVISGCVPLGTLSSSKVTILFVKQGNTTFQQGLIKAKYSNGESAYVFSSAHSQVLSTGQSAVVIGWLSWWSRFGGRDNSITVIVHICIVLLSFKISFISIISFHKNPVRITYFTSRTHFRKIIQNENK